MGNRVKLANYLYWGGLAVLIASLPLSKFTMSVSQMMLGLAWLLMGDYKNRINHFLNNKTAVAITAIFIIHVAGLIHTSNFDYALKDLRIKVPLLILPFMFASFPKPTEKFFNSLILLFSASVTVATTISFWRFIQDNIADYRELSPFISHIRFALLVCLAAFLMYYEAWRAPRPWLKATFLIIAFWLTAMLFVLQSATSLIIFFATAFVVVVHLGMARISALFRLILFFLILLPVVWGTWESVKIFRSFVDIPPYSLDTLEKRTASGNKYYHDTTSYWIENGRHAGLYLCPKELRREWNSRSSINFDSTDRKGQKISFTIIRYLTSIEKRKDSAGVASLSQSDIQNIENGIANHDYLIDSRFKTMINKISMGYYQYLWKKESKGSSLMQRIELWKTSLKLIKGNFWFGTGTGDLPDEFAKALASNHSGLTGSGLRSHNQFLSIASALGISGLIIFIVALIFILIHKKRWLDYQALVAYCIVVFSMFNEDTIETQAGVTFFTFFITFFFILKPNPADKGNHSDETCVES